MGQVGAKEWQPVGPSLSSTTFSTCLHTTPLSCGLRSSQPGIRGSTTGGGCSWRSLGDNWWYLTSTDTRSALSYISVALPSVVTSQFELFVCALWFVIIKFDLTWQVLPRTTAAARLIIEIQQFCSSSTSVAAPPHPAAPPGPSPKRSRCKFCPRQSDLKTSKMCQKCNAYICKDHAITTCLACNWGTFRLFLFWKVSFEVKVKCFGN